MTTINLCHVSPVGSVEQFRPLSHFGTLEAARDRAANASFADLKLHLYEVVLTFAKVLDLPDLNDSVRGSTHSWLRLADQLHYDVRPKRLTAGERDAVFAAGQQGDEAARQCLSEMLMASGWSAIRYKNNFEGIGAASWMNLTSSSVRIVSVRPWEQFLQTECAEAEQIEPALNPKE